MRLSELKTGEKGVIVKVLGHGGFRKRIVEMGFIKGKTVEVILNAPLKDPIKYRILGYEISLRRNEADMIEVISEEEARNFHAPFHGALEENEEISEGDLIRFAKGKRRTINVALVGNPNCGKTSLFNIASGAHEHVGNYSGVTVDAKEGFFDFQGYHFKIVDLPGTYSLSAYTPEEVYVRKHIINETPDVIINVVDTTNIERNLYLTTQLIDMNVRMVIALNMYDELESSGNTIDYKKLGELLGAPMLPTVCKKSRGIDELFHTVIGIYEGSDYFSKNIKEDVRKEVIDDFKEWHKEYVSDHNYGEKTNDIKQENNNTLISRHIHINHGPEIEKSIDILKMAIGKNEEVRYKYSTRFLAIKLLENDSDIETIVSSFNNGKEILEIRDRENERVKNVLNEDCEQAITDAKYGFIAGALQETYFNSHTKKNVITNFIDSLATNRIWGYPIFLLIMFLIFEGTFVLGDYPMQWIEWLVNLLGDAVRDNMTNGPLKDMIVDGIIGGVGGVIVFLPNILFLYFFISLLEDSGYMARAAFIMDKIMHKMGLHGKSFIPLVMGFGCNVPAIMASRTIEDRKSRLITMLVNPLMSCSARLPVYLVLVGAFFPSCASLVLFGIYLTGIILAVIMARIFNKFVVKGEETPFVMELPPYRMPTAKSIFRHTWEKGEQYLKKMGGIIMIASIIVWFLGYYPNHNDYNNVSEQQENSYIGTIGKVIEPVLKPLGLDWKLGVAIVSGVGAKEIVVSTLGVLYNGDGDDSNVNLADRIPITPITALSFMIFVLIYFPCIATLAAIKQESGSWKWALFAALYTTTLAWLMAFAVYNIGYLFF